MPDEIRIGVSLPQSGRDARGAWASHYNAYRVWLDEINGRGGLLGCPVELVIYDDGTRASRAVENYRRLIYEDKVDLLFAPARTRTIEQVAPVTEEARRLLFIGHGSGHAMFEQGRKYLFLGWPGTDFSTTRSFFEWATSAPGVPRPQRAALISPEDRRPSYTENPDRGINQHNTGIARGTRHYAEQFDVSLTEEHYTDDQSTYGDLWRRVKSSDPDLVMVANYALPGGPKQLMSLIGPYRDAGLGDALLWLYHVPSTSASGAGDRSVDPLQERHLVEPLFEGVFTYDQFDARSPNPMSRAFVQEFVRANDYVPDNISAGVYVACQLLEQAVEGARTVDNEALREYLLSHSFETIMGAYRFQENGVPLARELLLQVIQGALQVVYPGGERTAEVSVRT